MRRAVRAALAIVLFAAAGCGLQLVGTGDSGHLSENPTDATVDGAGDDAGHDVDGSTTDRDAAKPDVSAPDAIADAGCDADFTTNAQNCGGCGHDCLGGTCSDGTCAPVVLASGLDRPYYVAVSSAHVYATDYGHGKVIRIAVPHGNSPETFAEGLSTPLRIVLSSDQAYYETSNAVRRCSLTTSLPCPSGGSIVRSGLSNPRGLALDATRVFFTDNGDIYQSLPDGGSWTPIQSADTLWVMGIASDGTTVFFTDRYGNQVFKCSAATGCNNFPSTVAQGQLNPDAIVVYKNMLYWTARGTTGNFTDGAIRACNTSSCTSPIDIATNQFSPGEVAVDDSGIYWTVYGDGTTQGTVLTCPLTGCSGAPRVVAMAQAGPWGIAVDQTAVYWVNYDGGQLMKVAK